VVEAVEVVLVAHLVLVVLHQAVAVLAQILVEVQLPQLQILVAVVVEAQETAQLLALMAAQA
jgi:hypothetical protein